MAQVHTGLQTAASGNTGLLSGRDRETLHPFPHSGRPLSLIVVSECHHRRLRAGRGASARGRGTTGVLESAKELQQSGPVGQQFGGGFPRRLGGELPPGRRVIATRVDCVARRSGDAGLLAVGDQTDRVVPAEVTAVGDPAVAWGDWYFVGYGDGDWRRR